MNLHPVASAVVLFVLDDLATTACGSLARARGTIVLGAALDAPVEDIVVLVSLAHKEIAEELAQVRVVGLVVEAQGARVVEEDAELVGEATTEEVRGSGHLLLHDAVVLLLLGSSLEPLPRQGAAQEVHENVGEGLEVIAASLLNAKVGVDGSVAGSSSQILVLPVGDVEVGLGVAELLGETKVNDVDLVAALPDAHQEIVRLNVAVDEVARVDIFDSRNLTYVA
jgi:hypothetical protein